MQRSPHLLKKQKNKPAFEFLVHANIPRLLKYNPLVRYHRIHTGEANSFDKTGKQVFRVVNITQLPRNFRSYNEKKDLFWCMSVTRLEAHTA